MFKIPDLKQRKMEPEILDDLELDPASHKKALEELSKFFKLSRTAAPIWREILAFSRQRGHKTLRGIDIGTGSGDLPLTLTKKARDRKLPIVCDGLDFNVKTIEIAQEKTKKLDLPVRFLVSNVVKDPLPDDYDFIVSSLFLHHLDEEALVSLLRSFPKTNLKLAVFSDLIRSQLGWLLCAFVGNILTQSPVVKKDAILSLQAAYTPAEILLLAKRAGLKNVSMKRVWPERFLLIWRP